MTQFFYFKQELTKEIFDGWTSLLTSLSQAELFLLVSDKIIDAKLKDTCKYELIKQLLVV